MWNKKYNGKKSRNSALNFLPGWNTFLLEVVDLNWLEMLVSTLELVVFFLFLK